MTGEAPGALDERRQADAERLEAVAPGYLERVRAAVARLARRDVAAERSRVALAELRELVDVDVDVPTRSRRRAAGALKAAVKLLVGWYLRYLGDQVTAIGRATVALGEALVDRSERTAARTAALGEELQDLRARIERLEAAARDQTR